MPSMLRYNVMMAQARFHHASKGVTVERWPCAPGRRGCVLMDIGKEKRDVMQTYYPDGLATS